jgi:hypothetical protein
MQGNRWLQWILGFLLLLISCSNNTVLDTQPITITRATETVTPSTTSSPPQLTPTPTPIPTLPPEITPSPIRPSAGSPSPEPYRLKSWSLEEGQALFKEAYDRILQEWQGRDTLQATIILGEELLIRFPQLRQDPAFLLQLAYLQAHDYLSPASPAANFYEGLEIALNTNQVQPATLGSWLEPYGFAVADHFEAVNLFGDGQPAQVFHIERVRRSEYTVFATHDVVVALSGVQTGEYSFTPLRDTWLAYNLTSGGGGETITVADRNANGRLDITSIVDAHGHAGCHTEFGLFEWAGDKETGSFANIAPIPHLWSPYFDFSCMNVWHFDPPDTEGTQAIIRQINYHNLSGEECAGYKQQQVFTWNGTEYVFAEARSVPYDDSQPDKCRVGWAFYAPPEAAIPVFEPIRDHWLPEYIQWGTASEDFLLFKLGIWYALAGEQAASRTVMEQLATNPPNPQYTLFPRLAATFLDHYQSPADVHAACSAVIQTAQTDLDANPRASNDTSLETARMATLWGFFDRRWNNFNFVSLEVLCDRFEAFNVSISHLNATSTEELQTWFSEHEIPLLILKSIDFSGDGAADWLIATKKRYLWELYLAIKGNERTLLIPISSSRFPETSPLSSFEILNPSPDSGTTYLIHFADQLIGFQLHDQQVHVLLTTRGAASYTITSSESASQITVETTTGTEQVYTWNNERNIFETPPLYSPDYEQITAIREIRHILFDLGDAQTALTLLETLLAGEIIENGPEHGVPLVRPQLLYLLGLAYELTNNELAAIHTYQQLWQSYPDNPYSQTAKSKFVNFP